MAKKFLTNYLRVVQLFMLLLGASLIVLYVTVLSQNRWGMPLNSLGSGMIAATLLSFLHTAFGVDIPSVLEQKLALNVQVTEMGLTAVNPHLGDERIFERFKKARSIDMMYNTGKNTIHRHLDGIEEALANHACKVRVLISNPDSEVWGRDALIAGLCPGTDVKTEIKDVINRLQLLVDRVRKRSTATGSLEVRVYSSFPTGSIVIVDNAVARFTAYLPYSHSSEVPSYDVTANNRGGLFDSYKRSYERVWEAATEVMYKNFALPESSAVEFPKTQSVAKD
jgi:hypothetical protein